MSPGSASKANELQRGYAVALKKHLDGGPRASLRVAGNLGRRAVADGVSTAALTRMHTRALLTLVESGISSRAANSKVARANAFFVAALKPMDGTRRSAADGNGRFTRMKDTMRRGTVELAGTQRQLKRETERRKKLEAALRKSKQQLALLKRKSLREQKQLRLLNHRILAAQEDERKRISRELHDEIGQTLTAINVKLAKLKMESTINAKAVRQTIRSTQRLLESSMKRVHRFARKLRPPVLDELGLIPALHSHLDAFTKSSGVPVRLTTFTGVETLDSAKRTAVYRVTQEALANIAKHARASLVTMSIRKSEGLVLVTIHDNGRGFDVKRRLGAKRTRRLGLLGMRERLEMVGGRLEIESETQHGTTVRAQLPFGVRST